MVTLQVRKPIAFYGTQSVLGTQQLPAPDPLMLVDSTLPATALLPPVTLPAGGRALATVSTHDGLELIVGSAGKLQVVSTLDLSVSATVPIDGGPSVRALAVSP